MPYKNKKKPYRRFRRRPITYGQIGQKIWRDVRWLKSVINVEKKYLDTAVASNAINNTLTRILLNGMQQGTTAITRLGQSIKCASSFLRCYLTMNASATTTIFRIMLVKDKQPNGNTFNPGDLLTAPGEIQSPILIGSSRRFKVIHDKMFRLDTNKLNQEYKMFKKLSFHVEYNTGNAGTIADIPTNAYFLCFMSDQAVNTPNVDYYHRLRFIDN